MMDCRVEEPRSMSIVRRPTPGSINYKIIPAAAASWFRPIVFFCWYIVSACLRVQVVYVVKTVLRAFEISGQQGLVMEENGCMSTRFIVMTIDGSRSPGQVPVSIGRGLGGLHNGLRPEAAGTPPTTCPDRPRAGVHRGPQPHPPSLTLTRSPGPPQCPTLTAGSFHFGRRPRK